jgi:histidine triad (HIT) family protein
MPDCLFCKIVRETIPAKKVHDDELCIGFHDINPQAPTHVLFVPKRHIATTNELTPEDRELVGHLTLAAAKYARAQSFADAGYRLVVNCNRDAGQTVFHVHLHLLAGRQLQWPPG